MTNSQIAAIFYNIANLLQIRGEEDFRSRSYQRAAEAIESCPSEVSELHKNGDLQSIAGVGEAIAKKIEELLDTEKLEYYEQLKKSIPESALELIEVPGIGPKTAGELFRQLGVDNLESLEMALESGKLNSLKGIGSKTQGRIKSGIETLKSRKRLRPIGDAIAIADSILKNLHSLGATRSEIAGEVRRKVEIIRKVALVVEPLHLNQLKDAILNLPNVKKAEIAQDACIGELSGGFPICLFSSQPENFEAKLLFHTGSNLHLEKLNSLANSKGLSQLEAQPPKWTANKTESEIYRTLGLPYIPPELREGTHEVEEGELPKLIEIGDIRGNLHAHTNWSDGSNSIEEMLQAASDLGLEYFAITDHSTSLTVANGLSVDRLLNQIQTVREIAVNFPQLEVLVGSEVDILKDGSLDYPDEILEKLDIVIASVHTNFNLTESEMTKRVVRAMQNRHVKILGHPTGRLLSRREPYPINIHSIIEEAAKRKVVLEINASPDRLDLNSDHAKMAKEAEVGLSINCDAHHVKHLNFLPYGVWVARKAWLKPEDVVNCMNADEVKAWLKDR